LGKENSRIPTMIDVDNVSSRTFFTIFEVGASSLISTAEGKEWRRNPWEALSRSVVPCEGQAGRSLQEEEGPGEGRGGRVESLSLAEKSW
jgi:hypothetical protein